MKREMEEHDQSLSPEEREKERKKSLQEARAIMENAEQKKREHYQIVNAQYFCEFICNNISNFAIVKCFEIPVVNIFQTWYNVVISINGGR